MSLTATRISLLKRSIENWIRAQESAMRHLEKHPAKPDDSPTTKLVRLQLVEDRMNGIKADTDEIQLHSLALLERAEAVGVPCPALQQVATGPAWLLIEGTPERTLQLACELAALDATRAKAAGKAMPGAKAASAKPSKPGRMSKAAMAVAAVIDHPDWSNQQIADAVDCNVKSLNRMTKFKLAKQTLAGGRTELPPGSKDENGNLEAENE